MAGTGLSYLISPIIDRAGNLLDGTPLAEVIAWIDHTVTPRPAHYTVSCVHPSVLHEAPRSDERLRQLAGDRLLGIKANANALSPEELVAPGRLDADQPRSFADEMRGVRGLFGMRVLGGCCGTNNLHIEALAHRLTGAPN